MAPFEKYLSTDTFEWLNMTKVYTKFNISEFDKLKEDTKQLTRKRSDWYYWSYRPSHSWHIYLLQTMCYIHAMTYEASYDKIQKYYHIRFLYYNNVQYEAGYLVHEIIHKYQMMLEIYQMVTQKYFYSQDKNFAPISYMLYIYTNMLEFSMMVIHLCNMLHELNDKYIGYEEGIFDNEVIRSTATRSRGRRTVNPNYTSATEESTYANVQERVEEEKKRRRKVLKKERQKAIESGTWQLTTYPRRPKKSHIWPLEYGWSIEYW